MLSEEVIVALALGVPSLLVAAISLWIAFLTYNTSRSSFSPPASRVPSWPGAQHPTPFDAGAWPSSGSFLHNARDHVNAPQAAFPGPSLRRRA
ncbi:L-Aspartase-like protein [Apiospora arundinis]